MNWWHDIIDAFKAARVLEIAFVSSSGHTALVEACGVDNKIRAVPLNTPEEGVRRLQSSGTRNCMNMLPLATTCRFPLAMFVTVRGQ